MSSGVIAASECLQAFTELKMSKSLKYILFKLNDKRTQIIVDKTSENPDYEEFVNSLPADGCRWAVYDFEYKLEDGSQRNKLCFVSWSPDTAPIRAKMVHASSKDALRKSLDGIGIEIQGTDMTEVAYETVFDKVKRLSR
ncbi:actin depolymerizing factor [Suillus clintonianus]|uniref:actin depolymerizing factor n=1 Tax=Suillus clintonianus TaxID=1904413 RepID=UPI001B874B5B|nr:actin depolymerizing factor [Suillus clintonianus]KAG2114420.1 actin depolymerizing factor [Suillus clintonianus]